MIKQHSIPLAESATETAPGRLALRGFLSTDPTEGVDGAAYSAIAEWIRAQNPESELTFDFDSGGGDINGVEALCDAIASHPGPTRAIITGTCGSAAYWLASSCDRIEAAPSALIGSIGAMIPNALKPMSDADVVAHLSPRKNAPDEQWQNLIDASCDRFLRHVASHRGFSETDLVAIAKRVGEGKLMTADEALKRGLIDEITKGGSMDPEQMPDVVTDEEKSVEETIRDLRMVIDDHERRIAECEAKLADLKRESDDAEIVDAEDRAEDEADRADEQAKCQRATYSSRALASIEKQLQALYKTQREDIILRLLAEGKIKSPSDAEIARNTYDTNRTLFDRVYGRPSAMASVQRISSGEAAKQRPKKQENTPEAKAWAALKGEKHPTFCDLYKQNGGF